MDCAVILGTLGKILSKIVRLCESASVLRVVCIKENYTLQRKGFKKGGWAFEIGVGFLERFSFSRKS